MKNKKHKRPSMVDMKNNIYSSKLLLKVLNIIKLKPSNTKEIANQIDSIEQTFKILDEIPENFNKLFVKNGWVAYDAFDLNLMQECVELAKSNKFDEAEKLLFEYYSYEYIKDKIWRLSYQLDVVKIREELLNLCFEDFYNERYHACIPLLLCIIDGIVCDTNPQQKSGANADIDAWDSITCSDNGVNILYKKIIHKTRRKTTTDKITLPYRNGILHGRDLGYANKEVAVKTWHLFFAICSWANELKTEKSRKEEYIERHKNDDKPLLEVVQDIIDIQQKKKELDKMFNKWKPRQFENYKFPMDLFSSKFDKNSPEDALKNILLAWQKKQYGLIAKAILNTKPQDIKKKAGEIKQDLEHKQCISAKIVNIIDETISLTEIQINLEYKIYDEIKKYNDYKIRLICQDINGNPVPRNDKNSEITWRILPAVFYNII